MYAWLGTVWCFSMLSRHNRYVDLRLIGYFLKIHECGSLSAAAKELHVGQPSLSRQLRRLERELGVVLYTSGPGMSITAAGVSFVPIAQDLLNRARQAKIKVTSLKDELGPRLIIAGPPTTVADVIAPFIANSGESGLLANIRESLPNAVYKELELGRADIVVGTSPPPSHLTSIVLGSAPIWAQVPKDHELAHRKKLDVKEIAQYPIAIVDDNHNVRRVFDDALSQGGMSVDVAFETQSSHASQALAAAHRAICISSDDPRYGLIPIPIQYTGRSNKMEITLFAAWDPKHYAVEHIQATAQALREFYSARSQGEHLSIKLTSK